MSNFFKIDEFYKCAISCAIENDPRGIDIVNRELDYVNKEYNSISSDKELFDRDSLFNPYSDSRILNIAEDKEIKKIFCGIDMQTPELLLADRLNERGANIDLVITHHPNGCAYAKFYEVISMQADKNAINGVAINVSESLTNKRLAEVERSVSSSNHHRDVMTASLLNINYMCMHTLADNCVETFLTNEIKKLNPYRVSDIVDFLNTLEEYKLSAKGGNPVKLFNGSLKNRAGKVVVDMTGGACFDLAFISALANSGVSTLVVMHLKDNFIDECRKYNINVVVAGHMSSDSLGLNLLFKYIKDKSNKSFGIIPASGYIFVDR